MNQLYVCMVGLPARGKSRLALRIQQGLTGLGLRPALFNNGDLRRQRFAIPSADAQFFSFNNPDGVAARQEIATSTLSSAKEWLASGGDVAIIDATNGSEGQRIAILQALPDHPILFIECVNEDPVLLNTSILRKTRLPEFAHLSEAEALASFYQRIAYYTEEYRPVKNEPCWMRVDPVNCQILAEAPSNSIPYYAAIRDIISLRWVNNLYLVRHGETPYNEEGRLGGDPPLNANGQEQANSLSRHFAETPLPYVFTSTKLRTVQTAQTILSPKHRSTFTEMPEFDEIDAGICEGMTYDAIKTQMPEEYRKRSLDKYTYVYPEGESYQQLKKRVERGLRRALFMAGEDTLMIVGHQAINRIILSLFLFHREHDVPYSYIPQNQFFHITVTQRERFFEMIRYN